MRWCSGVTRGKVFFLGRGWYLKVGARGEGWSCFELQGDYIEKSYTDIVIEPILPR
jgi:hypothetical protein